ncbi:MAG: efflux RND transporter permease subunit [Planctomycetota bacterium]
MIRWFTVNGIAANFMMIAILVIGSYVALNRVPLEINPSLSWNVVMVEVPYRGGSVEDVERAVLVPVEQALQGIQGIESINAEGNRGRGEFRIEAKPGKDLRELMDDIEAQLSTIDTFPSETDPPQVFIPESANYFDIIELAVLGNLAPHQMRDVARKVQRDLLEMDGISRVDIEGALESELSIEIDVERLLAYDLSFAEVGDAIRGFSLDLPAGVIDSDSGTYVVRTRSQAYSETEFENIPIRNVNGAEVRLGDIATVSDGFVESEAKLFFNGKPAVFLPVLRVGGESALDIAAKVRQYVDETSERFPPGIELQVWDDESIEIQDRLTTLVWSLLQGGCCVLVILGLFIRPSVALWIAIGIPVSFAGAAIFMPVFGVTANVMSLFGFIIVMGIVVDDAIVTGENVYSKICDGMPSLEAAVTGTKEVATPVTFGAITTVVAFLPLLTFDGTWGDYASQIPPVVAPVLLFSLIESKLILPAHLKHVRKAHRQNLFARLQASIAGGLERFIEKVYQPTLVWAAGQRYFVAATFIALALALAGYCTGGKMAFIAFPKVDSNRIQARLDLPNDTPLEVTDRYVDRMMAALDQLSREYVDPGNGRSMVGPVVRLTGARRPGSTFDQSRGYVAFEVLPPEQRTELGPKNAELAARWSELVGEIPEARQFDIRSEASLVRDRGYDDEDLNIELRGPTTEAKKEVAREIKAMLEGYDSLKDQWAGINEGQDELEITLKPRAAELGLTQAMLASQVRQAFFGEEAQRIQRGVDDIRVMVRLPREDRKSLHTLDRLKIRAPSVSNADGTTRPAAEVPLSAVATVNSRTAPSWIERNDLAEVLRVGAQPVSEEVDVIGIAKEIQPRIEQLCAEANITYRFLGYVAEAEDTRRRTVIGGSLLMLTLYGLLAIALGSLIQPLYVLLAVPFAIIGALVGHILMGLTPSYLSIFGMLALAGIAVNDTLVMVDFINRRRSEGMTLREAALRAGRQRFRPILLTTITTFIGLTPLMMDTAIQSQFLIPMAVSLAFGVLFATMITLYLVPCTVLIGDDIRRAIVASWRWYIRPLKGVSTSG